MTNDNKDFIRKSLITIILVAIILLVIVPLTITLLSCTIPLSNLNCAMTIFKVFSLI